jgi:nucleotide-binding universal stress UspA family protein
MNADLLARPLVPVANPDDARETYEQFRPYILGAGAVPLVVHVAETAGGAPDKSGVEQSQVLAREAFDVFRGLAETDGIDVETEILYGTDVAETVHEAAAGHDASAIVFRSRGGSRWLELLSGNVRANLVAGSERPVIVLP